MNAKEAVLSTIYRSVEQTGGKPGQMIISSGMLHELTLNLDYYVGGGNYQTPVGYDGVWFGVPYRLVRDLKLWVVIIDGD